MTYASSVPYSPRLTFAQLWFSFTGRATRSDYWLKFTLVYCVLLAIASAIDQAMPLYSIVVPTDNGPVTIGMPVLQVLFALICIYPAIAVAAKRCHDRDKSGWFQLVVLIPLVGPIWVFVALGCKRGTVGPNRFGPDPLS